MVTAVSPAQVEIQDQLHLFVLYDCTICHGAAHQNQRVRLSQESLTGDGVFLSSLNGPKVVAMLMAVW